MDKSRYLSIIVVCYNMTREAPRTIYSLSESYQNNVYSDDYEILVIDNNSSEPLNKNEIEGIGKNIRYFYNKTDSRSPVSAIKMGVEIAKGDSLGILIDGARLVSPGMINWAMYSLNSFVNPFVSTLSWHLGQEQQYDSVPKVIFPRFHGHIVKHSFSIHTASGSDYQ